MEVRIKLESVSPVSWGGYDSSSDPLIVRIPSIRGSMRRWYRWYLASKRECLEKGFPDHKTIRSEEEKVFGGIHGDKASASRIRLYFDSLEDREAMTLSGKDPFLWPLRGSSKEFHMIEFDLVIEERRFKLQKGIEELEKEGDFCPVLEGVKALALNVTLGGFGYRSARGYGSFRVSDYEVRMKPEDSGSEKPHKCGEKIENILRMTKEANTTPNPTEWINSTEELLRNLGVEACKEHQFWEIQNLSNAYLVTMTGTWHWRNTLRELERRIRNVERALRAVRRNQTDFRVLLGSPVLDPFGRRPYKWKARRASPLLFGLSGKGAVFVRGVLMLSRDYPHSEDPLRDIMGHIDDKISEGFEKVLMELKRAGFRLERFEG